MTEKKKAKQGLLYDANSNEELIRERMQAKDLCFEYNRIKPSNLAKREGLLRKIIGKIGEKFLVEQPFYCDYGYNIEIGENFFSNYNLVILDAAKVAFGDNIWIGPNCSFYTAGHPVMTKIRNMGLEYAYPITVGNNVWFGGNVVVLPGVEIGDNTVIGAGSVVTGNIPANAVAVGNPCRVVRTLIENIQKF